MQVLRGVVARPERQRTETQRETRIKGVAQATRIALGAATKGGAGRLRPRRGALTPPAGQLVGCSVGAQPPLAAVGAQAASAIVR